MQILSKIVLILLLGNIACTGGGPLTPAESFYLIRNAVEKNDSEVIADNLSEPSLAKISKLKILIKDMRSDQLALLSEKYGYSQEKLKTLKISEAVYLYFFSEITGVKLNRYFKESIVSIDIHGRNSSVKTESGVELDFVREGPYWKFDLSAL